MPATRGPDRGRVQGCLAATRGPRQRACVGIIATARGPAQIVCAGITRRSVVRGPNRGRECAGMPGWSARWRMRAGQSRRRERRVAVVAITVAVVRVIASVSMRVPVRISVVIASVRVRSMIMRRRREDACPFACVRHRRSSLCHQLIAVAVAFVVAPEGLVLMDPGCCATCEKKSDHHGNSNKSATLKCHTHRGRTRQNGHTPRCTRPQANNQPSACAPTACRTS